MTADAPPVVAAFDGAPSADGWLGLVSPPDTVAVLDERESVL